MNEMSDAIALEIATKAGAAMYERDHAARALGIELAEIRPGFARMTMTVRDDMVNGHDICHGGFTFTLADTTLAYASNSYNAVAVAQTATITFTSPGRRGEILTAVSEERSHGGRTGIYDVAVSGEDGRAVAHFRGITQRIKGEVVAGLPISQ